MYGLAATSGLMLALASQAYAATSALTIKGSKFFTGDGNQFFIKGIAYQLTNDDPLADSTQCVLDINLMKTIGTNTIRVYHVDPSANHDTCMGALSDAGIYVFLDLDTFPTYILQENPEWNQTQYSAYQKVMDAFHNYDNVAGFFVGNEVLTTGAGSIAAPYIKAAARDMKAYRDSKGYRKIPVGYSAADISDLRPNLQNYVACGSNQSEAMDFYSLNAYEWCGDSSYDVSGYSQLQMNASDYNIPIFFSETGCNTVPPRTFGDQAAIFGSEMSGTWSGAIIYEWIEETNNYGLVSYGAPAAATATGNGIVAGYTRTGTPIPISPDFDNLSKAWATASPSGVQMNNYNPSNSPPACPAYTSGLWEVSSNQPLPTLGQGADYQQPSHSSTSGASSMAGSSSKSGSASASRTSGATAASGAASGSSTAAASSTAASAAMARSVPSSDANVMILGFIGLVGMIAVIGIL
ncbi:hypothetical protein LTR78_006878 [Recurvomyces mirabilis]|uniref:1,3-beta-glucanosyltransferase n=1 Tax=Recurvomyces mirabilis TaxID=574656 RepID=A0AAE0WKD9_9PEZI|nr:hypothetical protein LTR78_006878 [Recurvomyces mirabilis]KAK5153132.1 hypothetical protein LTS14_007776 [Recurvomyces mirabilis]